MMEAYGIKYIAAFESEVIGYNYEIRILERNYAGEVLLRNLGGAPELIKDNNGAVCGTSLEFLLETKNDGDLREFYTEDNKKFKVEVWRENKLFWLGFVVTEVYSEAMIPVADISIRATDGLGLLKNEPYDASGECQLLDIIKYCVDKSGLSLGFDFYTAIGFKGSLGSFIQYGNEVNAEVLLEYKNCYDALVALLDTFALSITQSCARWVIRHQAIVEKCWRYNENALPDEDVEKKVIKIGRMDQEEVTALPVNSLEMEIEPSRKNITVTEKQLTYPSLFENWNFATTRYWSGKGKYVTIGKEDCYFLPCIYKDFNAFNTISQKIKVDQTSGAIYLEIKYTVFTNRSDLEHQLWVYVYVEALNGTVYWLGKSGWKTGNAIQEELLFFTVSDLTTQFGDVKWNNLKIYVDGFPVYGDLAIKIYNIKSGVEIDSDNVGLYLSEVRLMYEIPGEIEKSIQLSSTASQDEDFTLVFGDYAYGSNVKASMMGGTGNVPNWVFIDSDERMTFLDIMCQIWANIYSRARRKLSGTILLLSHTDGEFESDFIYLYDDRRYLCLSGSYNLLADEIDIDLIEIDSLKPVIDNISFLSPRVADVASSVFRASSGTEYRTYSNANNVSMQPCMIRDLKRVADLNEDYLFEADNGSSSESEKVDFKAILNYLSDRYWTKEELACINGYLLYLNEKIKAGDSDLWEGHKFSDFLDQAVRKKDNVDFASLRSNEIRSDQFVAGALGEGFQLIKKDSSGKSYFEVDTLYARMKAVFSELEIRKMTYAGGNYVFSPAGMTCTDIIEMGDFYRCFFNADNGEKAVENLFKVDDLVQSRESNVKEGVYQQVKNNYYWRKCVAIGDNYIDLSKTDCSLNSDIPQVGDVMVTFGNKTNTTRQHVIVISVYGEGAPSFIQYAGIDDYSLEGKAKTIISPELNEFTGRLRFESGESVKSVISDSVKNGIDGIQIGGVNLINDSKNIFLATSDFPANSLREPGKISVTFNGPWNAYVWWNNFDGVLQSPNKEFIASVSIKTNRDATIHIPNQYLSISSGWIVSSIFDIKCVAGQWQRFSFNVTTPDYTDLIEFLFGMSSADQQGLIVEYKDYMFEAGNKASASWSPSVADQQNQIDDAKNAANAAQQSVMQVTKQVTQLIADNEGIKASVTTVEEKVDNVRPGTVNYLNDSRFDTLAGWYGQGGTVQLVQDEKFGPVVEYSRPEGGGEYERTFTLPAEELVNTELVYYVIAKQISNAKADFLFGGWSATFDKLNSNTANKIDLGSGWFQYWSTFKSSDILGNPVGINSISGTWRFYAAGVLKGNKPASWTPSLPDQQAEMDKQAKQKAFGQSWSSGAILYDDPAFKLGHNGIIVYNNNQNGAVEILRVDRMPDAVIVDSGYNLQITTKENAAEPAFGGFGFGTKSRANAIYITRILAKIPAGCTLEWRTNHIGDGAESYWATSNMGTGNWEEYIFVVKCGSSGIFSTTNYFYLSGNATLPLVWYLAYASVFDMTSSESLASQEAQAKADAAKNEANSYTDSKTTKRYHIDARSLDENKYYPVTIYIPAAEKTSLKLHTGLNGVKPSWATHASGFSVLCSWTSNGNGWGTIDVFRVVTDFTYAWSSVIPCGNIAQMTNSNYEYIYVRGGGYYYMDVVNERAGAPVLHNDTYTISNQTLYILDSVTAPVPTLEAVRVELQSQITVLKDQINITVSRNEYDANNTSLRSEIGQIRVDYQSISATVTNINNRLGTIETAGYLTTAQGNTLFASKTLEDGGTIVSKINQTAESVKIDAKNINLNGTVTANGNVQITVDGKLKAINAEISGKLVSGDVAITGGKFMGFELSSGWMTASHNNYSIRIAAGYDNSEQTGQFSKAHIYLGSPKGNLYLNDPLNQDWMIKLDGSMQQYNGYIDSAEVRAAILKTNNISAHNSTTFSINTNNKKMYMYGLNYRDQSGESGANWKNIQININTGRIAFW